MTIQETGFLLLTSQLGNPERRPLTTAQLRTLASRVRSGMKPDENREMTVEDLARLGYSREEANRILLLLSDTDLLEYYLSKAGRSGCIPLTRAGDHYPVSVRKCLGDDSPGCLWAKGDISLLRMPCVALVGSRDLHKENAQFAREAGIQAARQGYVLVSGNARGADQTAQQACLEAGGAVISVVADSLQKQKLRQSVLYLSEECFDTGFSSQRAHSRNRVIHSLGRMTFVAQSSLGKGGTWRGTAANLRSCWSRVFCFDDGSEAARELGIMGAELIGVQQLKNFDTLYGEKNNFLLEL